MIKNIQFVVTPVYRTGFPDFAEMFFTEIYGTVINGKLCCTYLPSRR